MTEKNIPWDEHLFSHWAVLNALDYCVTQGKIPCPLDVAIAAGQRLFAQDPMSDERMQSLLAFCYKIVGTSATEKLYPAGFRTLAEAIREDYRKSLGVDKAPQGGYGG